MLSGRKIFWLCSYLILTLLVNLLLNLETFFIVVILDIVLLLFNLAGLFLFLLCASLLYLFIIRNSSCALPQALIELKDKLVFRVCLRFELFNHGLITLKHDSFKCVHPFKAIFNSFGPQHEAITAGEHCKRELELR